MASPLCPSCGVEISPGSPQCQSCGSKIPETPRLDSLAGKIVAGKYRLLRRLGQGGMGVVYQAEHLGVGQKVAIKFLHATFSADAELAARFHNEARSYARIVHPHAIQLHDFGQDEDGNLFISMEFIDGRDLRKVLLEQGRLPPREALDIALQVADVLGAAHSTGVVHRDLKPENVMLAREMRGWHAKVLDFGLAQLADAGTKLTAPGAVFGTPRYMAPEQSEGGPLDARVDIYALGLVLFEMLTGKSPFDAPSVSGLMRQQRETPVPRLAEVAAGLGIAPSIDDAIQRATAKRPEDRFPSMVEFARILADALGHAPAAASVEESGPTLARAPSDKPVAPVHDPTLPSSRGRAAAPEPIPLVGGAPRAEPPADGASPRKLAAFVVAGAVAVAIAGLGAWSWRDQRGDRIRVLRAQLDEAYAANREPPPPEACREQDPEVLGKLAFAAHLLDDRQLVSEKRVAAGERAAAALFTAASTRRPEASYLLAKARLDADQLDPVLADAARRCAGFAAAENLAGVLAFRDKRLDDAEERFRAALTLAPGFANARANLGVLRLQQRRFAEAAELLEAAIAQQPDFAKALFALGLTRSAQAQAADEPEKSARLSQDANQAFCKALALGHPAAQAFCKR